MSKGVHHASIDDACSYSLQGVAGYTVDCDIVVRLAQNGGEACNKAMQLHGIWERHTHGEGHHSLVHGGDPSNVVATLEGGCDHRKLTTW